MAENRPYYYMRLKEGFFDSDELIALQSMKDGYLYSDILLKLYLRSLRRGGRLMVSDCIPYDAEMISKITKHSKKIVEKALENFKKLGLVEVLDSGAIYMTDIQEYIGKSSTEADRKRDYRSRIEAEKHGQMSGHLSAKRPPEIEKETELKLELKPEIEDREKTASSNSSSSSHPSLDEVKKYCNEKGLKVDPEHFWNYNEARNWMIDGKTINWRQLAATWNKTEHTKAEPAPRREPSYGDLSQYEEADPNWMRIAEKEKGGA